MSSDRMAMIKKAAEKRQMQQLIRNLDKRKADLKKQTKKVKKAKHQAPGRLDSFKEENLYFSESNNQRWMEGSSYFETYNAMKQQDEWD